MMDSQHKGSLIQNFAGFMVVSLQKLLKKKSIRSVHEIRHVDSYLSSPLCFELWCNFTSRYPFFRIIVLSYFTSSFLDVARNCFPRRRAIHPYMPLFYPEMCKVIDDEIIRYACNIIPWCEVIDTKCHQFEWLHFDNYLWIFYTLRCCPIHFKAK